MSNTNNLPILIIYFNRPDIFSRLLDSLSEFRPKEIFLSCDGPRVNSDDQLKIEACEKLIKEKITWDCNRHFRKSNLNYGCDSWVPTSISWFFNQVEAGIILEDDCLISKEFYLFSSELVNLYWNNTTVMNISAPNFQKNKWGYYDYYFSKYPSNWAWATWRRAWLNFSDMTDLDAFLSSCNGLEKVVKNPQERKYWKRFFIGLRAGKYTYWDAKWLYSIWRCNGVSITPNVNLSRNIGFGQSATHTKSFNEGHDLEIISLTMPIRHPPEIKIQEQADFFLFNSRYKPTFKGILISAVQKLLTSLNFT